MSQIFEIETEDQFSEKTKNSTKFLICFFATWCLPCQRFAPVIKEVSELPEFKNVLFVKVNIDKFPELATNYKVLSVPSTILISNEKESETVYGYKGAEEIREILNNFFN